MGTRNLTIVKYNNEIKVAQYGQWDGYPSGNGLVVLKFLETSNMDVFRKRLDSLKWIDDETHKRLWVEAGAKPEDEFVTMDISDKFKKLNPQLSRDLGAGILDYILKSEGELLIQDSISFAQDGLFCEWAYLVDLDENKLEVYQGFNKEPLDKSERFYCDGYVSDSGYTPIKLLKVYDLENLPTKKDFLKELEPEEDEE